MSPIKSSLARTVSKLLGVSKDTDLSLRGDVQINRRIYAYFTATGGTTNTSGSNYKYHKFTSPGNFVVTMEGNVDILLVGGGGGGTGSHYGGGGGGGMVVATSSASDRRNIPHRNWFRWNSNTSNADPGGNGGESTG